MAQPLLVIGALASACGASDDSVVAGSTEEPSAESRSSAPPTCDSQCQRRAERQAEAAERCQELLPDVTLTYRITAAPTAGGKEIGLHMTLVNHAEAPVGGSTSGFLRVAPGPPRNRISWGGSSADELYQKSGTVGRKQIWHDRQPPGWYPVGRKVTLFDFSTYVYAPGPGLVACKLPARVIAPPGLVSGHPSGRWTQESGKF